MTEKNGWKHWEHLAWDQMADIEPMRTFDKRKHEKKISKKRAQLHEGKFKQMKKNVREGAARIDLHVPLVFFFLAGRCTCYLVPNFLTK